MIIAVGSTNPTKLQPVREIFSKHFSDILVKGVAVTSGVREQPLHEEEMYQGAKNRAKQALEKIQDAAFGVGIEGGIHQHPYGWFERSLVVIIDRKGKIGIGASGGLVLPKRIVQRIEQGETLEDVMDSLFHTKNIGRGIGMFGLLTKGIVTRSSGVAHGVAFALAPFLHPDLYQD